jgi:hypothetical protein
LTKELVNLKINLFDIPQLMAVPLPNRIALDFHKAACLIWRMAVMMRTNNEQGPVDTAALRKRFNLPAQDSSLTLLESDLNKVA